MPERTYIMSDGKSIYLKLALRQAYEYLEEQLRDDDFICSVAIEQMHMFDEYHITLSAELIRIVGDEQE